MYYLVRRSWNISYRINLIYFWRFISLNVLLYGRFSGRLFKIKQEPWFWSQTSRQDILIQHGGRITIFQHKTVHLYDIDLEFFWKLLHFYSHKPIRTNPCAMQRHQDFKSLFRSFSLKNIFHPPNTYNIHFYSLMLTKK